MRTLFRLGWHIFLLILHFGAGSNVKYGMYPLKFLPESEVAIYLIGPDHSSCNTPVQLGYVWITRVILVIENKYLSHPHPHPWIHLYHYRQEHILRCMDMGCFSLTQIHTRHMHLSTCFNVYCLVVCSNIDEITNFRIYSNIKVAFEYSISSADSIKLRIYSNIGPPLISTISAAANPSKEE